MLMTYPLHLIRRAESIIKSLRNTEKQRLNFAFVRVLGIYFLKKTIFTSLKIMIR